MKKAIYLLTFFSFLVFSVIATAQETSRAGVEAGSIFRQGTKELGLTGLIDFEGPAGGVDVDLSATYGYFMNRFLEVGGFFSYSRELDGDLNTFGIGAFAEYHLLSSNFAFFVNAVPYLGVNAGFTFTESDISEDENAFVFTPKIGIKWLLRDYVAIDTHFFAKLATDDIYFNDGDLDNYDLGISIGLRIYF